MPSITSSVDLFALLLMLSVALSIVLLVLVVAQERRIRRLRHQLHKSILRADFDRNQRHIEDQASAARIALGQHPGRRDDDALIQLDHGDLPSFLRKQAE